MKFSRINAMLLSYYYASINSVDRIFDVIYWPIIDLVVWGFASFFIKNISNVNVMSMLLGGVILWVFVWRASQDIAVYVLEGFYSKNQYYLFSSPVTNAENIISIVILSFIRCLMTFVIMFILALVLYSFNVFTIPLFFLAIAIFLLSLFGWAMGLLVTSMIYFFGKRIQVLAWSTTWIIQPFSCVFYPLSALPGWAASIAVILPTTAVFENLRSYLSTGTINYWSLGYAFVANIAFLIISAIILHLSFEHARKTGLIAKSD